MQDGTEVKTHDEGALITQTGDVAQDDFPRCVGGCGEEVRYPGDVCSPCDLEAWRAERDAKAERAARAARMAAADFAALGREIRARVDEERAFRDASHDRDAMLGRIVGLRTFIEDNRAALSAWDRHDWAARRGDDDDDGEWESPAALMEAARFYLVEYRVPHRQGLVLPPVEERDLPIDTLLRVHTDLVDMLEYTEGPAARFPQFRGGQFSALHYLIPEGQDAREAWTVDRADDEAARGVALDAWRAAVEKSTDCARRGGASRVPVTVAALEQAADALCDAAACLAALVADASLTEGGMPPMMAAAVERALVLGPQMKHLQGVLDIVVEGAYATAVEGAAPPASPAPTSAAVSSCAPAGDAAVAHAGACRSAA